jgi:hypothetical protein
MGNPHAKVVELRRAVYGHILYQPNGEFASGAKIVIVETWPDWDAQQNCVVWHTGKETAVEFDATFADMSADEVYRMYFGHQVRPALADLSDTEWENHLTSCKLIVHELCAILKNQSLVESLSPHIAAERARVEWPADAFEGLERMCKRYVQTAKCSLGARCDCASGHKVCPLGAVCRRGREHCRLYHPVPASVESTNCATYVPPHCR